MLSPRTVDAESSLKYTIAVAKFENKSNWRGQWSLGDAWGAILTDSLNQTGRFIVIGEKDMRKAAMEEQDFAASGRAAGKGKKVVIGQMTPAQLLVKGEIVHFSDKTSGTGGGIGIAGFRIGGKTSEAEITTVMYIVDSSTGQVVASKKCEGKVSESGLSLGMSVAGFHGDIGGFKKTNAGKAMGMAVDQGVQFLEAQLEQIPWTGSIILVKHGKIYINRGEREGVTVGQTFTVGQMETLRDPDTGEILDQSMEKIGSIKVLKVKKKIAICKAVEGASFKKGMDIMTSQ
jgi:curli biogenesis system outer membrane secretion channel CsgG